MPIYEYKCDSCGHQFEAMQSMKDAPLSECEKCGKAVRKIYGAGGIIFKGSGFYVNDYKNKGCGNGSCSGCDN